MSDIATIGFRADTSGLIKAEQGLDRVTSAGKRTDTSLSALQKTVGIVGTALAAIGSTALASQLTKYADVATTIENRLRTVTTSTEQLASAQDRLLRIANATRSEYSSTVGLYSRLAQSTTELGLSSERLFRITETINKSFAASGATAIEASNAITQLAQGLASGALRGDEFNSVAEQAPEILRAVAAQTGKTVGELREFASQGGITAELLIKSLENYEQTVDRVYGKTNATLEQNSATAANNAIAWVGNNKLIMGSTAALGAALVSASENIDALASGVIAAAAVYTASLIPAMASSVTATYQKIAADIAATNTARALAAQELARVAAAKSADAATAQSALLTLQLDAQRKRSALEAIAAEMALEKQRLAAQISEIGRVQTATRMAEIGVARAAINRQLAATELELTAATTASNAASASAVAAQTALAGATVKTTAASAALSTATSFLLGPWGLLITALGAAAAAFYITRDSAEETTAKMDEQAAAVSKLAEKYSKFSSGNLAQTYADAQMQAIALSEKRIQIETRLAEIAGRSDITAYSERKRLNAELLVTNENLGKAELAVQAVNKVFDDGIPKIEQMTSGSEKAASAIQSIAASAKDAAKEMSKLDDAALDYFDALEELDEIEKDRISRKEEAIDAMLEPFEEAEKAVEQYTSISEKAAERIEESFADAWYNAFDGFESVVDGMKNAFKRMLAEMAHMALTKPIMVSLGMGDMMGAGSAGSSAISSALGKNALFASVSQYLGPMAIVASLGSMLSKALGGTGKNGALFGGLTGGLLGSWKTESDMLNLGVSGGDVTGSQTTTNVKKKFFKNRRESFTSDFDTSGIDAAFDAISMALSDSAQMFGITGADEIIKGFSAAANIDIKGKSQEEVQAAIAEWVGNTTNALVSAVFGDSLDGLQKEGEGVIDTVNRLSMNMGAVQSITKSLGLGFDLTGKAAMIASTNIVELAGGIDQLAALSSQYYAAFYTEAEQQQNLTNQLTSALTELNLAMPESRDEFKAYVDALDLTTEAGQAAFAALMQLVPGMDQYLSAIEMQKSATEQAAKAAEQAAAALKAQGLDLQVRLYDALGKSSEALVLRRQMEIEATDESLRAILLQIYAAQDASEAQKELASAQSAAADSARNAAAAARDMAQSAFSKLQDAAQVEKDRLATELDLKLETIDKEREALEAQRDSVIDGYRAQGQAVNDYVRKLEGLSGVINDFLGQTGAAEDPFKRLGQIFNEVKAGLLPEQGDLQAALSGVAGAGTGGFGSAADASFAMAVARNQASEIGRMIGGRAAGARSQVQLIEQQIVDAEKYFNDEMTKLDAAESLAKELHDEQVGKIDEQLSEAQKQLNALLGVDDRILTMSEAAAEFYAALASANNMSLVVESAQVEAINRVEAAVIALGVTIAEAVTPAPAPMDRPFVDPIAVGGVPNVGEPVTREMVDLLKDLVAAATATAKHTKTSANVLELNQYEAQELNP